MAEKLGERIRRKRQERGLGLRETAAKVGISAAYLSRIETDEEKTPPAEKVLRALADLLGDQFDNLMSLAGRIPSDVSEYITQDPGLPAFLRTARDRNLTAQELMDAINRAKNDKKDRR